MPLTSTVRLSVPGIFLTVATGYVFPGTVCAGVTTLFPVVGFIVTGGAKLPGFATVLPTVVAPIALVVGGALGFAALFLLLLPKKKFSMQRASYGDQAALTAQGIFLCC
jgi:hypothetical protein